MVNSPLRGGDSAYRGAPRFSNKRHKSKSLVLILMDPQPLPSGDDLADTLHKFVEKMDIRANVKEDVEILNKILSDNSGKLLSVLSHADEHFLRAHWVLASYTTESLRLLSLALWLAEAGLVDAAKVLLRSALDSAAQGVILECLAQSVKRRSGEPESGYLMRLRDESLKVQDGRRRPPFKHLAEKLNATHWIQLYKRLSRTVHADPQSLTTPLFTDDESVWAGFVRLFGTRLNEVVEPTSKALEFMRMGPMRWLDKKSMESLKKGRQDFLREEFRQAVDICLSILSEEVERLSQAQK